MSQPIAIRRRSHFRLTTLSALIGYPVRACAAGVECVWFCLSVCYPVRAKTHSSTSVAAEIAESTSWLKIWDLALDYGPRGTSAIQALFSTMTRPELCVGQPPVAFVKILSLQPIWITFCCVISLPTVQE